MQYMSKVSQNSGRSPCRVVTTVVETCILFVVLTEAAASGGRRLASTGDQLGVHYKPSVPEESSKATPTVKSKEIQDHAHFYSAADVLARWAETTFALSAHAHAQLATQPGGIDGSACVYDGKQCLFNPVLVAGASFPAPSNQAEEVLKRFAVEAFKCRSSSDRPSCHLDITCDWDDVTGACFLAHDPHGDLTTSIAPCRDMLYTARAASCWRRIPELESWRPCGMGACKLYRAGSGASWEGTFGGGTNGLPEDRCMPNLEVLGSPKSSHLKPLDMYTLLKQHFGGATWDTAHLENATAVAEAEAVAEAVAEDNTTAPPVLAGYGNCSTAALHFAMRTTCRHWEREACLQDTRCRWRSGLSSSFHCVLSRNTVLDLLLGPSPFTQAVRQAEATCRAATSEDACVKLVRAT